MGGKVKILIAEDDEITQLILQKLLEREGYKVILTNNGLEAWNVFQQKREEIDMVITDWLMPKMDGLELCKKIRNLDVSHYVYLIFITVRERREDVVIGLEAGADDYIPKPFDPHELLSRIRSGERVIEIDKRQRKVQKKLECLSLSDELTKVLNRRGIFGRLREEVDRATREKYLFSVMMLDIDNLKETNDRYGHDTGDKVLCEAVRRIRTCCRPYDAMGRYGGDEFLMIVAAEEKSVAYKFAERFHMAICEKPFEIDNKCVNITVSIGVTFVSTLNYEPEEIIKKADECLIKAKTAGKNMIVIQEI
jgi:diguanylate cyclase (GGDEF)-like protein